MSLFTFIPDSLNLKEKIVPFFKDNLPIAPTSCDIIAQLSGMKLLRFHKPVLNTQTTPLKTPLFIIPSMINRYYVLDLLPGKSFIEHLLLQGTDVYLLDWGRPYDEDNWLTLDQLVTQRLDFFMDKISANCGKEKINILGHCLGGTLAIIYSLLYAERINGLMLLTAPVDFAHSGKLGLWSKQNQFHPENVTKAYGHMPWWVLQTSFQMLKPMLPWHKIEKLMKEFKNPEFQKNFWALEIWSQDNVSFPGRCFLTLIEELYKKNALINGCMHVNGKTLDIKQLQGPILNIAANDDHIVPFNSTLQTHHLKNEASLETIASAGGHIGAILGSKAQKHTWPQIVNWLSKVDAGKH